MTLQIKFKSSKTSNKLMTSPPSCKKAGVGAGLDRRYIQLYVFRYAHAVYYSKTGLFCQDFDKTNYPVCPLTNRMDSGIIRIKRAYRMAVTPVNLAYFRNSRLMWKLGGYFSFVLRVRFLLLFCRIRITLQMTLHKVKNSIHVITQHLPCYCVFTQPGVGLTADRPFGTLVIPIIAKSDRFVKNLTA